MKILLLGGTGAMGISLTEILSLQGHDVYVTTRRKLFSEKENVHFITGNAHDNIFLKDLYNKHFDAIVDFMVYTTDEFRSKYSEILGATDHYMFLSSSRVYAESDTPITEQSKRLLDICSDHKYLSSDEYALTKARQENLLLESGKRNYTIIRPYITYNSNRLQLGVLEKEYWLQRALKDKTIIFQKEIAEKRTTLTYGYDVAMAMSLLIGNMEAMGEAFHITGEESILWKDVLGIYIDALREQYGNESKYVLEDSTDSVARFFGNYYQIHYDRLYDRVFDNSKIMSLCGDRLKFRSTKEGLKKSINEFLKNPEFLSVNLEWEAHCDGIANEPRTIQLNNVKQKVKYYIFKDLPMIGNILKKVKK